MRTERARARDAAKGAALLDEVAQALILADPSDTSTLAEVARTARVVSVWAEAVHGVPGQLASFVELADRLAASGGGPAGLEMMEELGRRFSDVQSAVSAYDGGGPATSRKKRAPGRTQATRGGGEKNKDGDLAEPLGVMPLAADAELLRDFVVRAVELLEAADEHLLLLEREPADAESLNAVFRTFHTIKGMAGFLALEDIESCAHRAEGVLDAPRKDGTALDRSGFDSVFASIDEMKRLVAASMPAARRAPASSLPAKDRSARGAGNDRAAEKPDTGVVTNSVRVDEDRLDGLLDTIGELVIAESMFSAAARAESVTFGALALQLERLDKITRQLQEMATSLRMVPLHSTFVRMARLVRDLSHKSGKPVEFSTSGADTELDKTVVDRIADPLMHMLRNAIDHGVESPEERRAAGKPESGRLRLEAFHSGGRIHITVTDDGRGFDAEAILAEARKRGLVDEGERPNERETLDLAFVPGLSTARTLTDVSGRGVGMDVVRRTVESLRGEIDVSTTPGQGTRISIRLPLTLAIIDGIVVRVGTDRYIIPTLSIERSVRPLRDQLSSVVGRGDVLNLDGRLIPILHLRRLFGVEGAEEDPTRGIVVIVGRDGERAGLVACDILGQQQIVIKSLGGAIQDTPGIAGGAIMPDGTVGLIVDVGGLVRLASS